MTYTFDDEDFDDDIESCFVDPDFDVIDGNIRITPVARFLSDESAGCAL